MALRQRLRAPVLPVEGQQVECPQVDSARPSPTHVQPGKVRTPVGIAGHNLAIEHCRLGRQLVQQLCDGGEALGEIVPVAAEDHDTRAHLVDLHAIAVELHLVQPAVAGGHVFGRHGAAGWDEAELGHDLRM